MKTLKFAAKSKKEKVSLQSSDSATFDDDSRSSRHAYVWIMSLQEDI